MDIHPRKRLSPEGTQPSLGRPGMPAGSATSHQENCKPRYWHKDNSGGSLPVHLLGSASQAQKRPCGRRCAARQEEESIFIDWGIHLETWRILEVDHVFGCTHCAWTSCQSSVGSMYSDTRSRPRMASPLTRQGTEGNCKRTTKSGMRSGQGQDKERHQCHM